MNNVLLIFLFLGTTSCASLWKDAAYITPTQSTSKIKTVCGNSFEINSGSEVISVLIPPETESQWTGPLVIPLFPVSGLSNIEKTPYSLKIVVSSSNHSVSVGERLYSDLQKWKIIAKGQAYIPDKIESTHGSYKLFFTSGDLKDSTTFNLEIPPGSVVTENFRVNFELRKKWHYFAVVPVTFSTCAFK